MAWLRAGLLEVSLTGGLCVGVLSVQAQRLEHGRAVVVLAVHAARGGVGGQVHLEQHQHLRQVVLQHVADHAVALPSHTEHHAAQPLLVSQAGLPCPTTRKVEAFSAALSQVVDAHPPTS